eukprot:TRINITY_DN3984_c0_g2_i1.p4 TRINITY_DN3984_c0_g2~~TRINITY_DN3984_c0_g2_i1.p4  ORF type:complete len:216 (-),score=14.98 TRINITY_DN3984_c0_g2_i1:758-1405(-)
MASQESTNQNYQNYTQNSIGYNGSERPLSAAPLVWTYIVVLTFMLFLSLTCYICRMLRISSYGQGQGFYGRGRGIGSQGGQLDMRRLPSEMKIVVQPDGQGIGYAISEEVYDNLEKKQEQTGEKRTRNNENKQDLINQHYLYITDSICIPFACVEQMERRDSSSNQQFYEIELQEVNNDRSNQEEEMIEIRIEQTENNSPNSQHNVTSLQETLKQ